MTDDEKLMQQALEALDYEAERGNDDGYRQLRDALRERLAQPEQEPVAWADMDVRGENKGLSWTPGHFHKTPLYTTPPQRKPWVGLTDEEVKSLPQWFPSHETAAVLPLIRAIEAKLKEKNT